MQYVALPLSLPAREPNKQDGEGRGEEILERFGAASSIHHSQLVTEAVKRREMTGMYSASVLLGYTMYTQANKYLGTFTEGTGALTTMSGQERCKIQKPPGILL